MKATIDQPRAEVAKRVHPPVAAETDLDLIPPHARVDLMLCPVGTGTSIDLWMFSLTDTAPEVVGSVRAPASGDGRFRKIAGSEVANAVAEKSAGALAVADFGVPSVLILNIPAGATGNIDFTAAPFAFRVIDAYARKVTTSADAGDTGQLATGAGAAISNVFALDVAAGVLVRATSIDPANHEIAAAGTLRWIRTQSTNADCKVYVTVVRIP